jgi:hypothetical protein
MKLRTGFATTASGMFNASLRVPSTGRTGRGRLHSRSTTRCAVCEGGSFGFLCCSILREEHKKAAGSFPAKFMAAETCLIILEGRFKYLLEGSHIADGVFQIF